jgi:hypothetical protein
MSAHFPQPTGDDKRRENSTTLEGGTAHLSRQSNGPQNQPRPGPTNESSPASPSTDSDGSGDRSRAIRRSLNLEGAFPLLLIGSALLVYAAVLANQEISSSGSHLPLWGLVGGVGGVIAGAGIYSTFWVPTEASELGTSNDWVTIPKTEWEVLRASRPNADRPSSPPRVAPAAIPPNSSQRATRRPIWEEDWDVDSEGFRAAAAPPAPADLVLRQIEDIEASLRKKVIRPPPD